MVRAPEPMSLAQVCRSVAALEQLRCSSFSSANTSGHLRRSALKLSTMRWSSVGLPARQSLAGDL